MFIETANSVVKAFETCQSIDPAPVRWKKGKLGMKDNWNRLAMDITHHNGEIFLTIIYYGPSRFAIWRPLRRQDAPTVIRQLGNVFLERGPPMEILTDNDTALTKKDFREFERNWHAHPQFRCDYSPSGKGIVDEVIGPLRLSQPERIVQYWRRPIGTKSPQRISFHLALRRLTRCIDTISE